jgi:hypothetical protein
VAEVNVILSHPSLIAQPKGRGADGITERLFMPAAKRVRPTFSSSCPEWADPRQPVDLVGGRSVGTLSTTSETWAAHYGLAR